MEDDLFIDHSKQVLWSPSGLGADDRAGLAGILYLLECGHRPHVLLTTGEESGGTGAAAFCNAYKRLKGVSFMVELDRKGKDEAVFYDCLNAEFERFILSYGFKRATGVFTDVCILSEHFDIAGVNLSCGFINAHSATEYFKVPLLEATLDRLGTMLTDVKRVPLRPYKANILPAFSGKGKGTNWDYWWYDSVYADQGKSMSAYAYKFTRVWLDINLDAKLLADLYGGSDEAWYAFLRENKDTLAQVAEDAAYDYIDRLCFDEEEV